MFHETYSQVPSADAELIANVRFKHKSISREDIHCANAGIDNLSFGNVNIGALAIDVQPPLLCKTKLTLLRVIITKLPTIKTALSIGMMVLVIFTTWIGQQFSIITTVVFSITHES